MYYSHIVKQLRYFGSDSEIFVESEKIFERQFCRTDEIVLDITSITISSNQYSFNFIYRARTLFDGNPDNSRAFSTFFRSSLFCANVLRMLNIINYFLQLNIVEYTQAAIKSYFFPL